MPWWLAAVASAHVPVIYVVGPTEDWCATINGTIGNDLVMLLPGEYRGPCVITADLSDVPVEETLLVSFDPADPAVFTGSDADFVLSIDGQRLVVWQLVFRGLGPGVDAVRVGPMVRTWIRASTFDSVETAVRQVGDVGELLVTQNHFVDVGTGVVIGCAGGACSAPAFEVHDNWFERTALAFDVATGSTGTFTDDVVTGAGTALRTAGDVAVTGAWFQSAGPAVDATAGTLTLGSSVVAGDVTGARDAVVVVTGSTVAGAVSLAAPGSVLRGSALDRAPTRGDLEGTVVCDDATSCFTDAAAFDFYPPPGSALRAAGQADPLAPLDWCGVTRPAAPTAGAWQAVGPASAGGLGSAFKDDLPCPEPGTSAHSGEHTGTAPEDHTGLPTTSTTGTTPTTDGAPVVAASPATGCGCGTTSPGNDVLVHIAPR
jgi:hypothetical protein